MMSSRARELLDKTDPSHTSFCCNLKKWSTVMEKYGIQKCKDQMWEMGKKVRASLEARGYKSVSGPKNQSPGVVVVYSPFEGMVGKFKTQEMQIAGGVPFKLGEEKLGIEPPKMCFRLGLFGLDKLKNISTVVSTLENALDSIKAAE